MTKKKKPELPQLPPGRSSFPHWLPGIDWTAKPSKKLAEMKPKEVERYRKDFERRERLSEEAKNLKHAKRRSQVWAMEEMTPGAFTKKYGYKKTLAKIHELVGEAEDVGPEAIKKSCDLVDAAIEGGHGRKFFVADLPTRKLGKKRPRSR